MIGMHTGIKSIYLTINMMMMIMMTWGGGGTVIKRSGMLT